MSKRTNKPYDPLMGNQVDSGAYLPTLEEIEEAKKQIQATWSKADRKKRQALPGRIPFSLSPIPYSKPKKPLSQS